MARILCDDTKLHCFYCKYIFHGVLILVLISNWILTGSYCKTLSLWIIDNNRLNYSHLKCGMHLEVIEKDYRCLIKLNYTTIVKKVLCNSTCKVAVGMVMLLLRIRQTLCPDLLVTWSNLEVIQFVLYRNVVGKCFMFILKS